MSIYIPIQGNSVEETNKQNTITIIIGTFLEYFDLYLYIHMGIILQEYFFGPSLGLEDKLWGAFYGWILSYIARPFGSMIFGSLGDNFGRKNIFILTTMVMGIASLSIAILPSYASCGSRATLFFIIARIFQSLSSAGEFPGAFTYLLEINRGQKYESFIFGLLQVASDAGGFVALIVAYICLGSDVEWAWRVPFLIGGLIATLGTFGRVSLKETPEYLSSKMVRNKSYLTNIRENIKIPHFFLVFALLIFPIENFFIYAMGAKKLEEWGCSSFHIVQYNVVLAFFAMMLSLSMAYLSLKFDQIKLVKFKAALSLILYPFIIWYYSICSDPFYFTCIQVALVLFGLSDVPILFLYIRAFHVSCRYGGFGTSWAFARLANNVGGAFFHTYFYKLMGYWGNLILFMLGGVIYLWLLDKLRQFKDM